MDKNELIPLALEARENSYSPYSSFRVGAALLTKGGKVYKGCNIENGAFSPTNCAERTAFFSAIAEGEREFSAIAVVGGKDEIKNFCPPCGVCRQVMSEFCDEDFKIHLYNGEEAKTYTLGELLPEGFNL
ncbi:MAG: cytidine deaminase [Clostridia bacterium]|jgi:cytidine deaminase|nr:cytidine deaminase [Clostridia bacterium]